MNVLLPDDINFAAYERETEAKQRVRPVANYIDEAAYSARSRTPFRCDRGRHSAVMADSVPR